MLLLLMGTACMAAPLPEIRTGTRGQAIEIPETYWYSGFVDASAAFLVGEVGEVSSDVRTTPQQTWLSESCEVRVESAFGQLAHIEGIKQATLTSGHPNSPYEPVDPKWGRLRHLKKGQKILLLLHEYEGGPCFGSEALIELTEATRTLPEILRRTALLPEQFTDEDLEVLKAAAPGLHAQLHEKRALWQEFMEEEAQKRRPALGFIIGGLAAIALLAFAAHKVVQNRRLRQSAP
ncbi:MAG: hypothetical protein ACO1TE_06555 [Prosthecobacter sp.]